MPAEPHLGRYDQWLGRPVGAVASDLESYTLLLRKWNAAQNLVSRETSELWSRHLIDGLQLVRYISPTDRRLVDIGSGGGLPAFPLAIALHPGWPGMSYTLIEANAKKVAFLKAARRELGLDWLEVRQARAEQAGEFPADIVTSRAVAPLSTLFTFVAPLISLDGRALLHKGREHVDEIAGARAKWRFDVVVHASDVDIDGVILEVTGLGPL